MAVARTTLSRGADGDAGASAQAIFERKQTEYADLIRYLAPVVAALLLLVGGIAFVSVAPTFGPVWGSTAAVIVVGVSFLGVLKLPLSVVNWQRGAAAERAAGARLASLLPHGYVILSDRRAPRVGGNIDHVAIGPGGVFVVETKTRDKRVEVMHGQIYVGDRAAPEIGRQASDLALRVQAAAGQLMSELRLTTIPIVCFVGKRPSGDRVADGATVVGARDLVAEILASPRVLGDEDAQRLADRLNKALPRND